MSIFAWGIIGVYLTWIVWDGIRLNADQTPMSIFAWGIIGVYLTWIVWDGIRLNAD